LSTAPTVSIIIPAWNAESWIAEAVSSAMGQTWPHVEVIVIDDQSTDRTVEIVESVADSRTRLLRQDHAGAAAARNRGFRESCGSLIQFLDADDVLGSDKLSLQVDALRESPDRSIASCAWARFSGDIESAETHAEAVWETSDPVEWLVRSLSGEGMMQPAAWLVPRALAEAAGPWDESLSLHDDGDYFARVLTKAARNVFVADAIVYYREVAGSLSRRRSRSAIESAFAVCRARHATLLAARDDTRSRGAVATQYAQFAYEFGSSAPDLAKQALSAIADLGAKPSDSIGGGSFRRAARLIGFDSAIRLRSRLARE
jgi:glycosyltransferase involved in cell wall biosynthesis